MRDKEVEAAMAMAMAVGACLVAICRERVHLGEHVAEKLAVRIVECQLPFGPHLEGRLVCCGWWGR